MFLDDIKKQTELAMMTRLAKSVPLKLLLDFLPPGSYIEFLPQLLFNFFTKFPLVSFITAKKKLRQSLTLLWTWLFSVSMLISRATQMSVVCCWVFSITYEMSPMYTNFLFDYSEVERHLPHFQSYCNLLFTHFLLLLLFITHAHLYGLIEFVRSV